MLVSKWGNSLAVRLPADLVRQLGLKEGDQIELEKADGSLQVKRLRRPEEILAELRRFRGRLPAKDRLNRQQASER